MPRKPIGRHKVLSVLSKHENGLGWSKLRQETELSKTGLNNILKDLEGKEKVGYNHREKKYVLKQEWRFKSRWSASVEYAEFERWLQGFRKVKDGIKIETEKNPKYLTVTSAGFFQNKFALYDTPELMSEAIGFQEGTLDLLKSRIEDFYAKYLKSVYFEETGPLKILVIATLEKE